MLVYSFMCAMLSFAVWNRTLPAQERLVLSVAVYYFALLCSFVAQNLERQFMHHVSLSILARTAAHVAIKSMTWPVEWGPYNPRPHIEWYVELCFSYMRTSHRTGNFDVRDFAHQAVKHYVAQRRALAAGRFNERNATRPPLADWSTPPEKLARHALNFSARLMTLCCPTVYGQNKEARDELVVNFVKWCGTDSPLTAMLSSEHGAPEGDDIDALHSEDPWCVEALIVHVGTHTLSNYRRVKCRGSTYTCSYQVLRLTRVPRTRSFQRCALLSFPCTRSISARTCT